LKELCPTQLPTVIQELADEGFVFAVLNLIHQLFVAYRGDFIPTFNSLVEIFAGMLV
jgi:hypothetical protein